VLLQDVPADAHIRFWQVLGQYLSHVLWWQKSFSVLLSVKLYFASSCLALSSKQILSLAFVHFWHYHLHLNQV
jgi:hypothetical protein